MVPPSVYVKSFLNTVPCIHIEKIFLAYFHPQEQTLSHYQESTTHQFTLRRVRWVSAAAQQEKMRLLSNHGLSNLKLRMTYWAPQIITGINLLLYIQVVVWRAKDFLLPLLLHTSQLMLSKVALQKGVWKQTPSPHENASSLCVQICNGERDKD